MPTVLLDGQFQSNIARSYYYAKVNMSLEHSETTDEVVWFDDSSK
jgi:hypothetical protein